MQQHDEQIDEINRKDGNVDFYKRYLKTNFQPTAEAIENASDLYKTVAYIEADDLEQVFHIGNMGPEDRITRIARSMHSVSVGDVIVEEDGTKHYVDSFGFGELA